MYQRLSSLPVDQLARLSSNEQQLLTYMILVAQISNWESPPNKHLATLMEVPRTRISRMRRNLAQKLDILTLGF